MSVQTIMWKEILPHTTFVLVLVNYCYNFPAAQPCLSLCYGTKQVCSSNSVYQGRLHDGRPQASEHARCKGTSILITIVMEFCL